MEHPTEFAGARIFSRPQLFFLPGITIFLFALATLLVSGALKPLPVPRYFPLVLAILGVALMSVGVFRRPKVLPVLGLAIFGLFTALECVLLVLEKSPLGDSGPLSLVPDDFHRAKSLHEDTTLPKYDGPARIGLNIPLFVTTWADGTAFTDKDLEKGTPTVLVFFQGRW